MVTDYEKYLILAGFHAGLRNIPQEDHVADLLDDLWKRISEYQRGCARKATAYLGQVQKEDCFK